MLRSIFTVFGNTSDKPTLVYPMTADKNLFQYPVNTHIEVDEDALINIWKRFLKKLKNDNCDNMDYLSAIFEAVGKGIPGDTTSGSISDVSVYIQSKMVAAVAVCLADYAEEANISLESLVVEVDNNDKENNSAEAKPFMILSGDFSGIQNFIYTIPSKGALKSLRGRSFYLELFMEYAVDSFLKKLNLSRSHVLYTGGGHFYLIIPNTKASRIALTEFESAFILGCLSIWEVHYIWQLVVPHARLANYRSLVSNVTYLLQWENLFDWQSYKDMHTVILMSCLMKTVSIMLYMKVIVNVQYVVHRQSH